MNIVKFLKEAGGQIQELIKIMTASATPKIPAQGKLAGQRLNTTVDSELAKQYLENYLTQQTPQPEWNRLIEQVETEHQANFPTRESLKHLADQHSLDFATLYLIKRILDIPANQDLQSRFQRALEQTQAEAPSGKFSSNPHFSDYLVLVAPAWDYVKTGPEIGTDFADARNLLTQVGIENHLLEIEPVGTAERNAEIIASEICRYSQQSPKELILVSGSSSGPAVAHALGEILEAHQLQKVKAWVNAVGILRGAPFADFFLTWPLRGILRLFMWIKGWQLDSVESLSVRVRRPRFQQIRLPENVLIINYLSIPLSGDISDLAKLNYKIIRKGGPNDGSCWIIDTIVPEGLSIVSLGTDHFINFDPQISLKVVAMAQTVIGSLKRN